jgi:hypothetical protein
MKQMQFIVTLKVVDECYSNRITSLAEQFNEWIEDNTLPNAIFLNFTTSSERSLTIAELSCFMSECEKFIDSNIIEWDYAISDGIEEQIRLDIYRCADAV